jgi:adenylate cyclase
MTTLAETVFRFDDYTLDLRRGALCHGASEVELRPKSFALLRYLVENAGRLVAKDELIEAVWPDVIVSDDSLTRCVSDVRHALGDDAQGLIKTLHRRGYLFAAVVEIKDAAPQGTWWRQLRRQSRVPCRRRDWHRAPS